MAVRWKPKVRALMTGLERAAVEARTVTELFAVYRRAVNEVGPRSHEAQKSRSDHGLRRAEEYMRRHYADSFGSRSCRAGRRVCAQVLFGALQRSSA